MKKEIITGKTIHLRNLREEDRSRKNCYLNHKISCGYTSVRERAARGRQCMAWERETGIADHLRGPRGNPLIRRPS